MWFAVVLFKSNLRIRIQIGRIKHSEAKASSKQSPQSAIQIGLSEQPLLNCLEYRIALSLHACTRIAADQVRAGPERDAHAFFHGLGEVMSVEDVGNRSAVGNHIAVKLPIVSQM